MSIVDIVLKCSLLPAYLWDMLWAPVWKRAMRHCGRGVYLRPMSSDIKGIHNLSVTALPSPRGPRSIAQTLS